MVKFSRELEAKLVPEWKDAFVDYRHLKKHVKKIKLSFLRSPPPSSPSAAADGGSGGCVGFSLLHPIRSLSVAFSSGSCHGDNQSPPIEEQNILELTPVQSREEMVKEFMEKLEEELEKVDGFYADKENEFGELFPILNKQLQILLDLKHLLHDHYDRRRRHLRRHTPPTPNESPDDGSTNALFSGAGSGEGALGAAAAKEDEESLTEGVIAAMERNGVRFLGHHAAAAKKKAAAKGRSLRATASLRIEIPATTPARAISMMWEDLVNSVRRAEGGSGAGGDFVNRRKLQRAEKMIREAFLQLFRGLDLLRTYSSLNMEAFRKIIKKFDKVSSQRHESTKFSEKVRSSHFVSSDKAVKMGDEVESIFTEHFAGGDKKMATKFLRPKLHRESHTLTFLVGLFTGAFVVLFGAYATLAYMSGIFSAPRGDREGSYVDNIYPIFSMFSLISLHVFLYGCNIYAWRRTRINHNFIFDFQPAAALRHKDAFLLSAALMTSLVAALLLHLLLRAAGLLSMHHVDAIPGAFLLAFCGVLFCPCNIFYRSTRYCFIRVMRNIVFSPFYKVLMVDFFMADQLTSQIPLLRHMEFTACYFIAARFKVHPFETCSRSHQFKLTAYIISFLPYYWRALQCLRRYFEEGYGADNLANAGKYLSAMVAAAARFKYAVEPTPVWLAVVVATSTGATFYQLFWDFFKDWGLFDLRSKNLFLRDRLILKNRRAYYFSIVLNFVLRLAWIESVMRLSVGQAEHRLIEFLLASLEVVRRGHWNFYRLENEQLNNAGNFRAVRTVPLPFSELLSDG